MRRSTGWWVRLALFLALGVVLPGQAAAQVVINELHYHPADWAVLPDENPDDLEFLELYNTSGSTVNLSGWSIGPGIQHVFPFGSSLGPGEYMVLAEEPVFLELRGPTIPVGVQLIKWDSGGLSNGGELIQLLDDSAVPVVIDSVLYDDTGLWPTDPDGDGPSLELVNPAFDNAYPSVWAASTGTNGTPGVVNSTLSQVPLVLWETPQRTSIVTTVTEISVMFAEPVTGVAAGNLTVNGSAATSLTGSGAGPYAFGGFTEPTVSPVTVVLAAGSIQDLDTNPFAGDTWIYSLEVPNVLINELHYNPTGLADLEEFIELYNAEPTAVDITGWALTEFADTPYIFPATTIIPSGGYVVVAQDPAALLLATGFSTPHQWPVGSLSNEDEPVQLTDNTGVQVDRVDYDDVPPWPRAADGDGPSLELVNPAIDNSQGQAWRAATLDHGTPGSLNSTYTENPIVLIESPPRGSIIVDLPTVTITFSESVTGVAASDLNVDSSPATSVTGSGAGPYVFSGYTAPTVSPVFVSLQPGAIEDADSNGFDGDSWLYSFNLPQVVINEIHYNTTSVGDLEEFIELHSMEGVPVDISGWSISGFADTPYIFESSTLIPTNGYIVVAKDTAALLSATGYSTPYQWPEGKLGDGGEPLLLSNDYGFEVDFVEYDDAVPWPLAADGEGPSLELVNPALDNALGQTWRASSGTHGTPGNLNSRYSEGPIVIIEDPPRGGLVSGLGEVAVTFSEPVTGVAAGNMIVEGVAASSVSGSGAGPYTFSVDSPAPGAVLVTMSGGAVQDLDTNPFTGDLWIYVNDQTSISMPDTAGAGPSDLVYVPVVATPATGIVEADISVTFNTSLLTALSVSKTVLSQHLTLVTDLGTPGVVDISLTGATPMAGTGAIVNIQFQVAGGATPGQTSPLDVSFAVLNQGGISPFLDDGLFTVCDSSDADSDGVSICNGDCDDGNPDRFPGNPEVCDNVDNDCNGQADDGIPQLPTSCGVGQCAGNVGQLLCVFGTEIDTCNPTEGSTPEICDGLDNNCNGPVDEGFTDTDTDGLADCVDPDDDNDGDGDVSDCAPLDPAFWNPPPDVTGVVLLGQGPTTLSWNDQGPGIVYDAAGGLVSALHSGGVDAAECLEDDLASPGMTDSRANPGVGEAYYYIVRSEHVCSGSYGNTSSGPERVPSSACP